MKTHFYVLCIFACLLWTAGCETKTKAMDRCGDGFLDPGEECDGPEMSVTTCQDLGFYEQLSALTCRGDCTIDVSACHGRCGDRVIQLMFGEQCDGENQVLTTNFCRARGYYGGVHGCSATCMLDESLCLDNGSCGDGTWQKEHESCDGVELGGQTCESLGYPGGTLSCGNTCRFDVSGCMGGETCGDGEINGPEQCDGENLQGKTCADMEGFAGGSLSCGSDCRFDTGRCHPEVVCGDGLVYGDEQCDGDNLMGQTCASIGLVSGVLTCGANCRFDTTGCSVQHYCGDGIVQTGEECDGTNLAEATCESLGFHGGTLACSANCTYDTSGCSDRCGNGILDEGEVCDGLELGGQTCEGLGYSPRSGELGCTEACGFDTTACTAKSSDSNLSSLTVSSGTLSPDFSSSNTSYSVTVSLSVESLTVAGTAADAPYASVAVSPAQPMMLVEGENPVTVTVTAEDETQKVYTVTVTRDSMNYESPNIGTLIYVPAGTFQRDGHATNLSEVSAFRMSKYEITRAQWTAVTEWEDPSNVTYSSGPGDPVQEVSWYHAIAFCNKLSLLEGLDPVYTVTGVDFATLTFDEIPTTSNNNWSAPTANWSANGYRLPTHMEWMWAAMGADTANPGAVNTTGRTKAFAGSTGSNLIGDYAVFGYNTTAPGRTMTERTNPVGTKLGNELGFHDLSGNVWEWVWDWYSTYPTGTVTDYRGPEHGTVRTRLGGSWGSDSGGCGVTSRYDGYPYFRNNYIGFRVVRP